MSDVDLASAAVAVALTVAWLGTIAVVRARRRPRQPTAAAPTLDLGDEPPAVVNLLANDFRVTRDAVPATLLDLAARRIVEIEQTHPGAYQCSLRSTEGADVTRYERRVLDVLRKRAVAGVVPAGALTTGPADESKRWWRQFKADVVEDAQRRGLSRDLWDAAVLRKLTLAALLPSPFLIAPLSFQFAFVDAVAAVSVIGWLKAGRRQRDTAAGLAAASRWLGVRARLGDDEVFATVPPFAVPMWDRYLSYGAALGVAAGAVRPIPMGAESDTRAWSSYGGRWRELRVRYPRVFPLGWGMSPASALLRALPAAVAAASFLFVVVPAVPDPRDEEGAIAVLAAALVVGPVVVALLAAFVVVQALFDLRPARVVIGQVVRLRTFGSDEHTKYYVAVDDGTATKIRAWRVDAALYQPLEQYEDVTAIVTGRLRHVHSISPRGV